MHHYQTMQMWVAIIGGGSEINKIARAHYLVDLMASSDHESHPWSSKEICNCKGSEGGWILASNVLNLVACGYGS